MASFKEHWQRIYSTSDSGQLSWFQQDPVVSLRLLDDAGLTAST